MNLSFLLGTFVILHSAFVIPAAAQDTLPRTALLMGVGDYGGAKYKGKTIQDLPGITTADLPGMEAKLKSLGFEVTVVPNPTLSMAKQAVDAFSARIKAAPGVSLFYFSGHGGEYEGKNYLIPRGASIASKADLGDEALSAQRVLNGMEESGAQVNLVFLDCCREDLGKSVGGAEMQPMKAKGSFIGFATRSGDFADPEAQGSPYTRFLLKHLDKPGVSVADMYSLVIGDVKSYSKTVLGEERRPGFYSELDAPFFFVPAKFTPAAPAMSEAEIECRARELAAKMTAQPAAFARILEVHTDQGFVSIDAGKKKNLRRGIRFDVRRAGVKIGTAIVTDSIEDEEAIADVPTDLKLFVGDELFPVLIDNEPQKDVDGSYPLLLQSMRAGQVTEIKPGNVKTWGNPRNASIGGINYWIVNVVYEVTTKSGRMEVEAQAWIKHDRVEKWVYGSSGEVVP